MTRARLATALAIAATLAASGRASAQSPPPVLTLDQAIAAALAHNPSLARTALDVARADHAVATSRSRRLPSFQLDGQASQLLRPIDIRFPEGAFGVPGVTTIRTPTRPTFYLNAQIAQPLTGLRALGIGVRLSETARAIDREAVRSAELALIAEVRRLYYGLVGSESALAAAEAAIRVLDEVERLVDSRVVQRVALRSDALDVRARRASADERRLASVHAIAAHKEQLNRLLGRDVGTPFDTTGGVDDAAPEIDLPLARQRALADRPDLRQARLDEQRAALATALARAEALPEINLAASYLSPFNIDGAPRSIASLAVTVEWEPFDWGRRRRTIATRVLESQQAAYARRDAEAAAIIDVQEQARHIERARTRLRAASLARDAAHETIRIRASQFRVQAALLRDVLAAEAALADAEADRQQALADLGTAQAGFERAIGQR
jgi:outer membrane protein TolC